MEKLPWREIMIAVLTAATGALGGNAVFSASERGEIKTKVEQVEDRVVKCSELDRFANGMVQVLNLSLSQAPPSRRARFAQEQFVREATTLINGLGC